MIRRSAPLCLLGAFSLIVAGAVGCSGSGGSTGLVPVTGVVLLDGDPVDDATVTFQPVGDGISSQALTAPDGTFSVESSSDRGQTYQSGLKPGEYLVGVQKLDTEKARSTNTPPEDLLPKQYASPETSGFTATISDGGENNVELKLTSGK